MEENETTTEEGQGEGSHVNPASPETAVSNTPEVSPESMTLSELNGFLGKNFKDKATALSSLKETFSYVGKRKEDILKEAGVYNEATTKEIREIKENLFYKDNPDLTPYRGAISKMGSNPEEVVNTPEFKQIFEKAIGNDKDQKLKSVLVSNPRIAASKDNLTKAREAMESGNRELAEKNAVAAVLATLE